MKKQKPTAKKSNINPTVQKLRDENAKLKLQVNKNPLPSGAISNHIDTVKKNITGKITDINTKVSELNKYITENL